MSLICDKSFLVGRENGLRMRDGGRGVSSCLVIGKLDMIYRMYIDVIL